MKYPPIVSDVEWREARDRLLLKEKALTCELDSLAADRRRLPMVQIASNYQFQTPVEKVSLLDLFDGRDQLVIYHHMLKPQDPAPCAGCSMVADSIGPLEHLNARNVSFAMVAKTPIDEIQTLKQRMQWTFPFFETLDSFNLDMGISEGFGLSVFLQKDDLVFKTYFTKGRGVETLGSPWSFLDLVPLGRQETWENSPEGYPQTAPYQWWRLHDEY